MAKYVGMRYVPIFRGDWTNTKEYEPLMIVSYQGNSYTSKTYVPTMVDILNTTYWECTGNYNAQVEVYRQEVINRGKGIVNVMSEGVKGDGTDETVKMLAALQKAIDLHATLYVPCGVTVSVDVLKITDSSNFNIQIDGYLKGIDNASYEGLPARSQLTFINCRNFNIISYNADMNVAHNGVTIKEHRHALELYRCSDFTLGVVRAKNVCGDVVYIAECTNVRSNFIGGYAEDTGRNTLSIISGENMQFSNIISIGVGLPRMPSGVDLEPNVSTEYIRNIQFGNVYVNSMGTSGFGLGNGAGADCRNVVASNVIINKKTRTGDVLLQTGISVTNFKHVKIKGVVTENQATVSNLTTTGLFVEGGEDIQLDINIYNVAGGAMVGMNSETKNINIKGTIRDIKGYGLAPGLIKDSFFEIVFENINIGGGSNGHIMFMGGVINNCVFNKCRFVKGTTGWIATYYDAATSATNCKFIDCDFVGWASLDECQGGFPQQTVLRVNCRGFNYYPTMPKVSGWAKGEYVENTNPSILGTTPNKYVVKGWKRLTAGGSCTLNVDWYEDRAMLGI